MIPPRVAQKRRQASYNNIDYRLRPGKYAERQMIVEAIGRLRFHDLKSYRYVGMGSIYFTDFKLLFRSLGISSMISIEQEEDDRDRFDWNKPYDQVQMLYGSTSVHLPALDWSHPSIVWLDYDGQIAGSKLDDLDLVVSKAASGTMVMISVNAEKPAPEGMRKEDREADPILALRTMIGRERTPTDLKPEQLRGAQAVKVYYRIIRDAVEASLARTNALITQPSQKLVWKQLLNFQYKDGASMITVGGAVFKAEHINSFDAGNFTALDFYRPDEKPYVIEIPRLTTKEMAQLEKSAALDPAICADLPWLDNKERSLFIKMYRYLPNFVSAEL